MAGQVLNAQKAFLRSRRWFALVGVMGAMLPFSAAQTQTTPNCLPTTTLEQLPKAIDDAVSGPGNKDRTCLRSVVLPEVRLVPVTVAADRQVKTTILTLDDFVDRMAKRGDKTFYEHQIKYASETYGKIAHLWSTYTVAETPDGKPLVRGINSIEAVNDGAQWRVLEISWQAETPETPLPAEFLP